MNAPLRIVNDPDASTFERSLLEAWKDEKPSNDARKRTLAALGIATGVSLGAAAGGSIAPKAIGAGSAALLKWFMLGVVGVLAVGGVSTAVIYSRSSDAPAPAAKITNPASLPVSHDAPTPTVNAVTQAPSAPDNATNPIDVSSLATAPPIVNTKSAQSSPASHASASIAGEISALDQARSALSGGDTDRALRLVNEYESRYPSGTFTQEAEVLRVDALTRAGNRDAAARAGNRFLANYPKSPHAARVRALIGAE